MSDNNKPKSKTRGFAGWDKDYQREVSSKGGRAAHEQGVGHHYTSEEARAAGKIGGAVVSMNREHMAEIGRIGGTARAKKQREKIAARNNSTGG